MKVNNNSNFTDKNLSIENLGSSFSIKLTVILKDLYEKEFIINGNKAPLLNDNSFSITTEKVVLQGDRWNPMTRYTNVHIKLNSGIPKYITEEIPFYITEEKATPNQHFYGYPSRSYPDHRLPNGELVEILIHNNNKRYFRIVNNYPYALKFGLKNTNNTSAITFKIVSNHLREPIIYTKNFIISPY